jgi:hypothetical protein
MSVLGISSASSFNGINRPINFMDTGGVPCEEWSWQFICYFDELDGLKRSTVRKVNTTKEQHTKDIC